MRVVSWNVNGIRACVRHGFVDFMDRPAPISSASRRSARGPRTSHRPPVGRRAGTRRSRSPSAGAIAVSASTRSSSPFGWTTSLGVPRFDREGRFMGAHFQTARGRFVVVNGYFPKGSGPAQDKQPGRLQARLLSDGLRRAQALRRRGPVLVIGDYNTAHRAIDLARPQANVTHSGFLPEERAELDRWIDAGWVDAFRALHPEAPDQYTWWRQWGGARARNVGWRIDYVLASPAAMRHIHEAFIWARRTGLRPLPGRGRYRPVAETSDRSRTSLDETLTPLYVKTVVQAAKSAAWRAR